MGRLNPNVSVIIPTYNRAALISQAISSVMEQTLAPLEIIVVDDGSSDDTQNVVSHHSAGIRYFRQENAGPSAARNVGLSHARGEMIAFLDSDDAWLPMKLEVQLSLFDRDPSLDIVSGRVQVVRFKIENGRRDIEKIGEPVHIFPHLTSTLLRKTCFDRVGLFDARLRAAEDMDWMLKANERGLKRIFHPEVVSRRAMHDSNVTLDARLTDQSTLTVIRSSLERRRKNKDLRLTPMNITDVSS